jgi:hypothetical protein
MLCHCSDCKRLTGSVFAMHYPIGPGNFTITAGEPKVYNFKHPTGVVTAASFCGDCGTWLYKQVETDQWHGFYFVQAGTTDLEPGMEAQGYWTGKPVVELWVSERPAWLAPVEGAEQKAQF